MAFNATAKLSLGKEADYLREDSAPLIHEPLCAVRVAQPCLAAVKSRQTKNNLNSLPIHHLPTSLSALAGQQCMPLFFTSYAVIKAKSALAILSSLPLLIPASCGCGAPR